MEEKFEDVKILLCEDDENLGMLLREYLEAKGFEADLCVDGEEGYDAFCSNKYDLCILDVMMPKMDGFTLASKIRELNADVPFIFLTAKTLIEDIRSGFEIGADDYITKPFRMDVVVLRIEAILRRVRGKLNKNEVVRSIGKYTYDTQKQVLTIGDEEKKLTTKEAELLTLLSNKVNELLPREYALKAIWIDDNYFNARSMDVYITELRKHLSLDPNVEILNVHGKGYKLVISDNNAEDIVDE
jgi:DNA-binding response OmpR family regulator